ncbi:ATP-binding protein involved in chromosome partitioning [uncultured Gammaproteobacteria bacterium]
MTQLTEAQVLDALRTVIEPDRRTDIVALNMVGGISIDNGDVTVVIEIDPQRAGRAEPIRHAAENAIRRLAGVRHVSAVLTAHRAPPSMPATGHSHSHGGSHGGGCGGSGGKPAGGPGEGKSPVPGVRAIVAVASGKGGVGKSTTAVNLALALAATGRKVGMLDADIYGPSLPRLLGLTGKPVVSTDGKKMMPLTNYGLTVMSIGFLMPEDQPTIWRGPMVHGALTQLLRDVAWGELDVLIVDMPPGTGDAQLTMAQTVPLAGAVIVSTPQDIALIDARKGLAMFQKTEVPVFGIVENMSYFCCPNCGERTDIFGHGGARREAEKLGVEFLGEVPLHLDIRETSDQGRPIVVAKPDSEHAHAYHAIAAKVARSLG